MKVLFVQEEPVLATALKLTLLKKGYEINFCKSAREAIKSMRASHPDVLIADIALSQKSNQLVSDAKRNKIPVILLGNSDSEEQLQLAFDMEADDYAASPLSLQELSLRVNKLTQHKSVA